MTKERLQVLYQHYLLGTLTALEHKEWQSMLTNRDLKQALEEIVEEGWYEFSDNELLYMNKKTEDEIFEHIISLPQQKNRKINGWKPYMVAASLFFLVITSLYLHNYKLSNKTKSPKAYNQKIRPGGNNAYLTLSNGKKIALNDKKDGVLAMQNGVQILKTGDGRITYSVTGTNMVTDNSYNVIETPKGGQYQITLPDGTRVWLNAASSLKYPSAFKGNERKVELSGEAYFEVSKNKAMPFKVMTNTQTVEVLGTHFNINGYSEELVTKTTLLEGSVSVKNNHNTTSVVISPGQQARIMANVNDKIGVVEADTEEVMAWKNNYFRFNNENIKSVMRKISRWYDVNVEYEGNISDEEFNGTISRTKNIAQVLEMLEDTKSVHFKVEGRRIVVMQ
jgi:transmembrane sensor